MAACLFDNSLDTRGPAEIIGPVSADYLLNPLLNGYISASRNALQMSVLFIVQ
jgi:hypothetical protein